MHTQVVEPNSQVTLTSYNLHPSDIKKARSTHSGTAGQYAKA